MPRRSLAIVAGNELHAARLRDALDERGARLAETVTVVTLGNAAGLDVDEVILTLGYARGVAGTVPPRLGVLSEASGVQALVQAVVASHEQLTVVAALGPEDLAAVAEGAEHDGVEGFRDLVLAAQGEPVPAERPEPAPGDWLLADIAARLRAQGYAVHVRYGAGADAIPLVVGGRHDRGYRVAVVTDEASRGGAVSVRDRLRHQYAGLEALGWSVVPLWTLDVFMDPDAAVAAIIDAVEQQKAPLVWEQPALDLGVETSQIRVPSPEVFDVAALDAVTGAIPELRAPEPAPAEPEAPAPTEAPDVTLGISVMLAEQILVDRVETRTRAIQAELDLDGATDETDDEAMTDETDPADADTEAEAEAGAEAGDASSLPSPPPVRPATRGTGRPLIPTRASEDLDEGWGGSYGGSNRDDEIKRERPPHW